MSWMSKRDSLSKIRLLNYVSGVGFPLITATKNLSMLDGQIEHHSDLSRLTNS